MIDPFPRCSCPTNIDRAQRQVNDHPPRRRPTSLLFAVVFVAAYASGFASSLILNRDRVRREAERISRTFIEKAIQAGIIRVDQVRLAEIGRPASTHPGRQHR